MAQSTVPGAVNFSWTSNAGDGNALDTDNIMLAVYNPVKDEAVDLKAAATRMEELATVNVPADFTGDEVHTWIACISDDGQQVSLSDYARAVLVA